MTPREKKVHELDIARRFLKELGELDPVRVTQPEKDPPDVIVETGDRRRIALELTRLPVESHQELRQIESGEFQLFVATESQLADQGMPGLRAEVRFMAPPRIATRLLASEAERLAATIGDMWDRHESERAITIAGADATIFLSVAAHRPTSAPRVLRRGSGAYQPPDFRQIEQVIRRKERALTGGSSPLGSEPWIVLYHEGMNHRIWIELPDPSTVDPIPSGFSRIYCFDAFTGDIVRLRSTTAEG